MNSIELKFDDKEGAFVVEQEQERLAEMTFRVSDGNMIVTHTHVAEELRGQKVADKLLEEMVTYARKNDLKVVPLCAFVQVQFKRNPERYADIWNQDWRR